MVASLLRALIRFGGVRSLLCGIAALANGSGIRAEVPASSLQWSDDLLRSASTWSIHMNDAQVAVEAGALRVAIAPNRTWAIAAVPAVRLPSNTAQVHVKVRAFKGKSGWLMRLYGDLRGKGSPSTTSLFERCLTVGESLAEPDPRLLQRNDSAPVQLQLGLEGEPGDCAVFESIRFVPDSRRETPMVVPGQKNIACVDLMPRIPHPFKMIDWRARAHAYDRYVFNFDARGEFLPLIWIDDSRINIDRPMFGLYSYVGDKRQGAANHEGINVMGAVLGATLVGINKTLGPHNYVLMCEGYYNRKNGLNLVLNTQNQETGGSFWYEIWPHILFYAITDRYPGLGSIDGIVRTTADRWAEACRTMIDTTGKPNFDHTAFNLRTGKAVDNGQWREPDAAAGIGWIQYMAWLRYRDEKYLRAAEACMSFLNERLPNPYYEVLMPYGAYLAARMNAELDRHYNLDKFVDWCFGISDCRGGWGVILGRWGGYDCHGLVGSVDNRGGYAFAMNTFAQAGALVPLVRYDTRYARAIGKWMLHLANAARLFYPNELPRDHQSSAHWKGDPDGVIAYEGLRREWDGKSPYATGDPIAMKWGPATDLGLYGSSYVGILGAIVHRTSDEKILSLDCTATDFCRGRTFPTFLLYNPYEQDRQVEWTTGATSCDLYDAVTHRFVARGVRDPVRFTVPADRAVVLVCVPANAALRSEGPRLWANDTVIDFHAAPR